MEGIEYIIVVQCHLVVERCSGYFCEKAFNERVDGFADLAKDKKYRVMYLSCGGCCGRALQRKVSHLLRLIKAKEGLTRDKIAVQFATCITKESHHADVCPHVDYLKDMIKKLDMDVREDTHISSLSKKRRCEGEYQE